MFRATVYKSQRCTVVQSTVVWAVRLSRPIGNTRFRPPCGTKTSQPIKTKIGRGDHAGEYIRSAKKFGGPLSGGAPTQWPFVTLLWLCSHPPFFSRTTGQTLLSPTMYYASNDVVSLIHVPFGVTVAKIQILGSPAPKTAKIFPQTRKSHLK